MLDGTREERGGVMEVRVDIKPLSVNDAWQGRRFKTPAYRKYEEAVLLMLPNGKLPEPPYEVWYEWGFSNMQSDVGNPEKCVSDILQKKYGFNDNQIMQMPYLPRRMLFSMWETSKTRLLITCTI